MAGADRRLAYWGDQETDRWWTDHIGRFGAQPALSRAADAINLLKAPAVVALYSGRAAALAAGRWDLVARLLTVYGWGRGAVSGLGEAAMDRAPLMWP